MQAPTQADERERDKKCGKLKKRAEKQKNTEKKKHNERKDRER